jgi:hypothetical protein
VVKTAYPNVTNVVDSDIIFYFVEQIHVEQQMIEGTAKFVNVCKNEQQVTHLVFARPVSFSWCSHTVIQMKTNLLLKNK